MGHHNEFDQAKTVFKIHRAPQARVRTDPEGTEVAKRAGLRGSPKLTPVHLPSRDYRRYSPRTPSDRWEASRKKYAL